MRVALTFDTEFPGRPTLPDPEGRILETLASAEIRAAFFLQGRWVRANPDVARRIAEAGHLVGNHSNYHAPMDALSDDWLRRDVGRGEATIMEITGIDPRPWFRCPFGSGMDDPRVLAALEELGYRHVGWDIDPRDWEDGLTLDDLLERTVGEGIILLHAWPAVTADGLAQLIAAFRRRGAQFAGIEELL
jgi:peptidoglycan/xylan/chitin deacetylase (PgdA/CDA1 family)